MVKSVYFLKPAWCGNHSAGLRPEQGLQPVIRATALQAVVCHSMFTMRSRIACLINSAVVFTPMTCIISYL